MLKKIDSTCLRVMAFSVVFLAFQSVGYAQPSGLEFRNIVAEYGNSRFTLPKSELQYQEMVRRENERYGYAVENLKGIYLQEAANIAQAKKQCGTDLSCRKYLSDEGKRLVNDYVQALDEVKEIYGFRRRQLNEARKNFTPLEKRIDNSIIRRNDGRIYERRIDDSIIQQNGRIYRRRN